PTFAVACIAALALAACDGVAEKSAAEGRRAPAARAAVSANPDAAPATPVLNTFINASIEIDQFGSGAQPDDANLFTGPDPADGTASVQKPTGGPANFIDWNDLGNDLANHRILDAYSGKDPTAFPGSNECVGPAQ